MSVRILSQVWEKSQHKGGQLLVLLALADFADDDGASWASLRKIAQKARLDERQARRVLRALEAAGEISTEFRQRDNGSATSNRYMVHPGRATTGRLPDKMSEGGKTPDPGKMPPGGADTPTPPGVDTRGTRVPAPPLDPSSEPSDDPSPIAAPASPTAAIARKPDSAVPKPRNPCFDALALACGSDPRQMTPRAARACGVALAEILKVAPEAKPDDFHVRAAKYHRLFRDAAISPNALAMHWAECGAVMPARQVDDDPEPEHWRQTIEEHYPDATILSDRRPWSILPKFVRQNVRECLTQIKRNQGQAA